MWKVNVIGTNVTVAEPQNPNDTVIFVNGGCGNGGLDDNADDGRPDNEYVSD